MFSTCCKRTLLKIALSVELSGWTAQQQQQQQNLSVDI